MYIVVKSGCLDWMSCNKRGLRYVKLAPGECSVGFYTFGEFSAETDGWKGFCWFCC